MTESYEDEAGLWELVSEDTGVKSWVLAKPAKKPAKKSKKAKKA